MTLAQQAESIGSIAESLKEKGVLLRHLQDVEAARGALEAETTELRSAADAVRALRSIGLQPNLVHGAFEHAAGAFEALIDGERSSLVADPSQVGPALKPVAEARKSAARSLQDLHTAWREKSVGDLDAVASFAAAVQDLWPRVHAEVLRLVQDVKVGRNSLPTMESIGLVVRAIERLEEIPKEIAPTDETRRFLVAALASGAEFDDLTDSVRDWLRDQGLERRLRVRIAGSDD